MTIDEKDAINAARHRATAIGALIEAVADNTGDPGTQSCLRGLETLTDMLCQQLAAIVEGAAE